MDKDRKSFYLTSAILLLFLAACTIHYRLVKQYRAGSSFFTQMLYLPAGKYLKPASFGYHALFSDFVYLWSIQYYGDPGFHPKVEYLKHTYDIITELDPHYLDAYHTGALFMFYEGRNPQAGLDLLDKGLERNPDQWILPLDAGFYCMMNLKRKDLAAEYFAKAAKIPGAHSLAKRAQASMKFKLGDKQTALALWTEVYHTEQHPSVKQSAYQHMHDLKVLIDLDHIRGAIATFTEQMNRFPLNLEQLYSQGFLQEQPYDPEGNPYQYDPKTGAVEYSQQLTLYKRFQ